MKTKAISILVIAALILSATAWVLTGKQSERTTSSLEVAELYPDLRDSAEDISRISIFTKTESATLERDDDSWRLVDRGGFPAKLESVRQLILQVSDLETVEKYTANPKQHYKLELKDPAAEGADSDEEGVGSRVVIEGKSGKELASVIIGKRKFGAPGSSSQQLFVRRADEDQTWLAKGRVDVFTALSRWSDTQVSRIERDRIKEVVIDHADDAEDLTLTKAEESQRDFTLADVPEGMKVKSNATLGSVAGALGYLSFTDVVPVADVDFATSPGPVAEYRTWDGLVVRAIQTEQGNKDYVKLEIELDEKILTAREAEAAEEATDEEETFSPDPTDRFKSPEEVRAEAEELRAKVDGWAYEFAASTIVNLAKKKGELIEEQTEEVAPEDIPVTGLPEGALDQLSPEDRAALLENIQQSMQTPPAVTQPAVSPEALPENLETAAIEEAAPATPVEETPAPEAESAAAEGKETPTNERAANESATVEETPAESEPAESAPLASDDRVTTP